MWRQRCPGRPGSSKFGYPIGDQDWVNRAIHWKAVIEQVQPCSRRPWLSEHSNAHGGLDWASLQMHLEARIEGGWRCNWRLKLSTLRDALEGRDRASFKHALGGQDWANLEMYPKSAIERNAGELGGSRFGGMHDGFWDSIYWLTCFMQITRVKYNKIGREMRNWLGAAVCRSWDDAVLSINWWSWHGEIERDNLT
jgi:hypothetical protein